PKPHLVVGGWLQTIKPAEHIKTLIEETKGALPIGAANFPSYQAAIGRFHIDSGEVGHFQCWEESASPNLYRAGGNSMNGQRPLPGFGGVIGESHEQFLGPCALTLGACAPTRASADSSINAEVEICSVAQPLGHQLLF